MSRITSSDTSPPPSKLEEGLSEKNGHHTLEFKNLSFEIKTKKDGHKALVNNVSGKVQSGEMLAVLGPSGAGKSTFLDLLAGRKTLSGGQVLFDSTADFNIVDVASYVEQDDSLLGVLTVEETLKLSAKLSLPPSTSNKALEERTQSILKGLGLSHVASQRIGTPIQRGISGGQKRRVTVGNSLITLPKVLFLDEPTSGLDSQTSYEVMSSVKKLAQEFQIIVVATIHSPNWETFSLFDQTLLLARGLPMYRGKTLEIAQYFASLGHTCPQHTNPADFVMSLVSTDFSSSDDHAITYTDATPRSTSNILAQKGDVDAFASQFQRYDSETQSANSSEPKESSPIYSKNKNSSAQNFKTFWFKTWILLYRNWLNYSRNLLAYGVRAAMYVGMGILLATVWVNLKQDSDHLNDRLSVHFFGVAFLAFMSVAATPSFLEERAVFMRERRNGLYGPASYTLAQTFITLPFLFICSVLFTVICYWSIGLNPGASQFFKFLAFLFLAIVAAEYQTLLIASIIPIFIAALAVAAFSFGFLMAVQGYFMRNLPAWVYYWAHFIDFQTYAFQLLVKNDLDGLVFPCSGSIADNSCQCSFPSSLISQGVCALKGEDVTQSLGFGGISTVLYAFLIVIIIVVYRILFYIVLRIKK